MTAATTVPQSTTHSTASSLLRKLLITSDEPVLLILRLTLGLVMLPHGLQKTIGMFGGHGFSGTMGYFTGPLGIPAILAVLVIAAESLGSLGLITGFLTRVSALGITAVMMGAIFMSHLPNGFFMNWTGAQAGEGFEFHLLAIGIAVALMIGGAGRWSIDRLLSRR